MHTDLPDGISSYQAQAKSICYLGCSALTPEVSGYVTARASVSGSPEMPFAASCSPARPIQELAGVKGEFFSRRCSPTAGSWLLELRASLPAQGLDTARSPRGMLRSSAQAMHPGMPQEEPCTSVSSNNSSRLSNPLVFLEILQAIKTA